MASGGPRGQQGRTAGARRRPEAGRAYRPVPLPRMRALEACAELDKGRTDVYRAVRGVLRERRHNSPVTCCRRLRSAEVPSGRRPAGACCRWKGLSRGWDRLERRTKERVGGIAVVEQPQPVHPSDARTWVEEHATEDSPADPCRPTGQGLYIRRGAPAERVGVSARACAAAEGWTGSPHIVDPSEEGDGVTVWHRQMPRGGHTGFYCLCNNVFCYSLYVIISTCGAAWLGIESNAPWVWHPT
ncbi:uncharacterized protein LOC111946759 [Oryzias latipes]|uniref:uncharacterized protein LOC111946759 n=1 Tax=Oryzias latipes TaxID=8090 RepID=UPI000CE18980|nr:uncharacterized protein LOC111946759 [Oryzias latipes]